RRGSVVSGGVRASSLEPRIDRHGFFFSAPLAGRLLEPYHLHLLRQFHFARGLPSPPRGRPSFRTTAKSFTRFIRVAPPFRTRSLRNFLIASEDCSLGWQSCRRVVQTTSSQDLFPAFLNACSPTYPNREATSR